MSGKRPGSSPKRTSAEKDQEKSSGTLAKIVTPISQGINAAATARGFDASRIQEELAEIPSRHQGRKSA